MFPLQENDESLFEDLPVFREDKLLEDLLAEHVAVPEGNAGDFTSADAKKKKRKDSVDVSSVVNGEGSSKESKKVTHKFVERQRRQEMAGLYASLRSILPLEYIKGKRSVSDHMHEAVKYIKDMQMKTEEMQMRRDKLKNLFSLSSAVDQEQENISDVLKVNLSGEEVEILIRSGEGFSLSKVILELMGEGLDVVSCLSTRVINDKFLHKVLIKASCLTGDDHLSELQQRLAHVIKMDDLEKHANG